MDKNPAPKPKRVGRPPKVTEFDALLTVLQTLKPLSHEERNRVMETSMVWLAKNKPATIDPANQ